MPSKRLDELFRQLSRISERSNKREDVRARMKAFGAAISASDVESIMREAHAGDPVAKCLAGAVLFEGWGCTCDRGQGVRWYEQSATAGNEYAQFVLGGMYEYGVGVGKDVNQAAEWYRLAAAQGHGQAQSALGVMLMEFKVLFHTSSQKQDGVKLLTQAAEKGVWTAMFNLALAYEQGDGIDQDRDEALRRYRALARKGHAKAKEKVKELGGGLWRRFFVRKALPS